MKNTTMKNPIIKTTPLSRFKAFLNPQSKKNVEEVEAKTWKRKALPRPPNLDPLVGKAYHNVAVNPLCRIPDEVILIIMRRLDVVDLACLRRTSRIFLRLHEVLRFHDVPDRPVLGPWLAQGFFDLTSSERRCLRERLFRDRYCYRCRLVRLTGRGGTATSSLILYGKGLYCSGCVDMHSAGLFSTQERYSESRTLRGACIAHEGHLRVCQHRVITWADIQRWTTNLSADTPTYWVVLCKAPSHRSQCSKKPGSGVGGDGIGVWLRFISYTQIQVDILWEIHVSVHRTNTETMRYEASDMRRVAESLHRDAGQYIVPRFQPDEPPHMAAFDPHSCACLDYAGAGCLDWQLASPTFNRHSCRARRSRAIFNRESIFHRPSIFPHVGPNAHVANYEVNHGWSRHEKFKIGFRRCCSERLGTGVVVTHSHSFRLSCGHMRWPLTTTVPNPVPHEWYRVMNPASYGVLGDEGTRHLLWCPEERCANHVSRALGVDRFRNVPSLQRGWRR